MNSIILTLILLLMIILHDVQVIAGDFDIKFGLTKKTQQKITMSIPTPPRFR